MPRRTNERVAIAVATLASFLTPFMGSATNVALPAIGPEMRLDAVALTWVATAYLLSAAVFLRFSVMSTVATKELVTSGLAAHSWIWMRVWLRSTT
jgi:hypothetical protein